MIEQKKEEGYGKIAPTAWGVAYDRAQGDIKYAKEIFDEIDAVVAPTDPLEIEYMEHKKRARNSPMFEARYKLINRLIAENKTDQILEIASGLAPRGLAMTEEDPSLCYVEVDLPVMAENKRRILDNLFTKGRANPQKNLCIENGDALSLESLEKATVCFEKKPVTIVNEGLLRYLSFEQKALVAKNISTLLGKFGGTWITSDITLARALSNRDERKVNKELVKALSGIDVDKNSFQDVEEAVNYFQNLGFTVERHSFLEVIDDLISPKNIGLSEEETRSLLTPFVVFVMRPKKDSTI